MAVHKYRRVGDIVYFHFALNDASGNRKDGAPVTFQVRLCGAAVDAGLVHSGSATLLTSTGFGDGSFEVAVTASSGAFSASGEYAVFIQASVSGITPGGMIGSFQLYPNLSNVVQLEDGSASTKFSALIDTISLTSGSLSSLLSGVMSAYNVASVGDVSAVGPDSAAISAIVAGALANYVIPTSAAISAIVAGNLTNYDVATSADVSTIVSAVLNSYNVASAGEHVLADVRKVLGSAIAVSGQGNRGIGYA
jgi:hypothetical protein